MLDFLKKALTKNITLKLFSLLLAIIAWYYIVNELDKGSMEERALIQKIFPSYGMITKKLLIKPSLVGQPHRRYRIVKDKILVVPDYCIVVGPSKMLKDIKHIYTTPLDVNGASETFTKSIPLTPIAPGIYTEETLVAVTVPVEKMNP